MFTVLTYQMTIANGEIMTSHNVYLESEAKLIFTKLLRDSRVSGLNFVGQFETLNEAQAKQAELKG